MGNTTSFNNHSECEKIQLNLFNELKNYKKYCANYKQDLEDLNNDYNDQSNDYDKLISEHRILLEENEEIIKNSSITQTENDKLRYNQLMVGELQSDNNELLSKNNELQFKNDELLSMVLLLHLCLIPFF